VHEVVIAPDALSKSDPRYAIFAHHTTVEETAKVFNEVKPKLAAYSHISKLYGRNEQDLLKRIKVNYSGPVIVGEDLMSFSISDTVSINTWQKK
jgi:ribonuclease Z